MVLDTAKRIVIYAERHDAECRYAECHLLRAMAPLNLEKHEKVGKPCDRLDLFVIILSVCPWQAFPD